MSLSSKIRAIRRWTRLVRAVHGRRVMAVRRPDQFLVLPAQASQISTRPFFAFRDFFCGLLTCLRRRYQNGFACASKSNLNKAFFGFSRFFLFFFDLLRQAVSKWFCLRKQVKRPQGRFCNFAIFRKEPRSQNSATLERPGQPSPALDSPGPGRLRHGSLWRQGSPAQEK